MTSSLKSPILVDVKADLRERLLHVAIKLFADRGIEAVSMRTINTEAGTKNKSAVHYHFGSKEGILKAIFNLIYEKVAVPVQELWQRIDERADKDELSVQEILLILYTPIILIDRTPDLGPDVLKLWAKVVLDPPGKTSGFNNELLDTHLEAILAMLSKRLPDKNKAHLRFQITHSLFALITGTAALESPIIDDIENAKIDDTVEMLFAFIDYASGGISNTEPSQNKVDVQFWESYFSQYFEVDFDELSRIKKL